MGKVKLNDEMKKPDNIMLNDGTIAVPGDVFDERLVSPAALERLKHKRILIEVGGATKVTKEMRTAAEIVKDDTDSFTETGRREKAERKKAKKG